MAKVIVMAITVLALCACTAEKESPGPSGAGMLEAYIEKAGRFFVQPYR
ncbi:MAG: hypothetical protein HC896_17840 [Bacteroidales bacterium]|nr:hypothetical protein [Bacteroidales bacterium]